VHYLIDTDSTLTACSESVNPTKLTSKQLSAAHPELALVFEKCALSG